MHWIKRDLINGGQASVYYSGARDNPHNSPEYIETLDSLTGVLHKRLALGQWVQAEGAVYDTFDHSIHAKERDPGDFHTWAMAIDEGYTNPAVILLVGVDSDGRWHIHREWYERGKLQSAVVAQAQEWRTQYNTTTAAVDASAAGLIADLRNNGVPARGAKGGVFEGIQAIQNRLKKAGDNKPRLTVDPSCTQTISEFESYCWKQDRASGSSKDEPLKENDHAMDAIRYLAASGIIDPLKLVDWA